MITLVKSTRTVRTSNTKSSTSQQGLYLGRRQIPKVDGAAATKRLIQPHPNTYTFSKCIAEAAVQKEVTDIPCAIVRPAIVPPAVHEPAKRETSVVKVE